MIDAVHPLFRFFSFLFFLFLISTKSVRFGEEKLPGKIFLVATDVRFCSISVSNRVWHVGIFFVDS